jgi:L-ascorbate metabolism protein UlaG (beta-lactamase superfamily)
MKITWLGHSGFRIEIGGAVILIDPWLTGNPMFPADRRAEAVTGATHILVTHGHGDHSGDAVAIARDLGIPVAGTYDLIAHWEATEGISGIGFNKGGTIELASARATLVTAAHSSSLSGPAGPIYAGREAGFMIAGDGHTIYVSGDTTVMADMGWMGEYFAPDIGILSCGGYYTMDMRMAAWAAKKYFAFRTVIPCHYRTFPALAQTADELRAGLPGVRVIEPEVLVPIIP